MREERDHQSKWIDLSIDFEGNNMKHENRNEKLESEEQLRVESEVRK